MRIGGKVVENVCGIRIKYSAITIAAIFLILFCSCGSSEPVDSGNAEKIQQLGDVLVDDLQKQLLPNRKTPQNVVDYGYVLSEKDESSGTDALAKFFVDYEGRNDCEVTIVFAQESFVVSRVIFIDGAGYYLRYEYDKSSPDEIQISGRLIDRVDLKYKKDPPKWSMTLSLKKKEIASFTLKNPTA